jgi:hypothetical protein
MDIIETPLKINDFKIGDLVTPWCVKNHAYGKTLIVSEIWEIGRGGKDGRVIANGFSFMPQQLKNQSRIIP